MKIIICHTIFLFCLSASVFAQSSRILNKEETKSLINEMGAPNLPLLRAYEYQDNGGVYNLLLCEDQKEIKGQDTFSSKIEAICYLNDHGGYLEQWKINDFINASKESPDNENSIWFWTKYCTNTDIDKDKMIDPVIVFGTKNDDGIRRVKIITLYKGKKYAIRAVECDLDDCRSFKKDDSIKTLPHKIQVYLDALLERMRNDQGILLKNG